MGKKIWLSKTFWVNLVAILALVIQSQTGFVVGPEKQMAARGRPSLCMRCDVTWGLGRETGIEPV